MTFPLKTRQRQAPLLLSLFRQVGSCYDSPDFPARVLRRGRIFEEPVGGSPKSEFCVCVCVWEVLESFSSLFSIHA